MKFIVIKKRLSAELQVQYAEKIESETQQLKARLIEEYSQYRCEVHGEQLDFELEFGPNIHSGVIASYGFEGCCAEFVEDIYRMLDA